MVKAIQLFQVIMMFHFKDRFYDVFIVINVDCYVNVGLFPISFQWYAWFFPQGYLDTGCAQYSNPVRGYDGPTYPYLPRSPSGVELTGNAEFVLEVGEFSQSHAALGVNESLRCAVVLSPNFPLYRSPSRWRSSPSSQQEVWCIEVVKSLFVVPLFNHVVF